MLSEKQKYNIRRKADKLENQYRQGYIDFDQYVDKLVKLYKPYKKEEK